MSLMDLFKRNGGNATKPQSESAAERAFLSGANVKEMHANAIVNSMRQLKLEKFTFFVRIHLARELDVNASEFDKPSHKIVYEDENDETKIWKCRNNIKEYNSSSLLEHCFERHRTEIIQFLTSENNIGTEGIFRKSGNVQQQEELKLYIETRDFPIGLESLQCYSVHDCATVFKGFLLDMSEPLLPIAHYPAHVAIAELCQRVAAASREDNAEPEPKAQGKKLLVCVQYLMHLLPDQSQRLFYDLIEMLHAIAEHEAENNMSADDLAVIFVPILFCPRKMPPLAFNYMSRQMAPVLAFMVRRGTQIFGVPAKLNTELREYMINRKRKMLAGEPLTDASTVTTAYSYIDREQTAAVHAATPINPELTALIQLMPKSAQNELANTLKGKKKK